MKKTKNNFFQNLRKPFLEGLPFAMSGLLFLSAFFILFSPLPLLILSFVRKKAVLLSALLVNAALVFAFSKHLGLAAVFLVYVGVPALVIPELLRAKKTTLSKTVLTPFLLMVGLTVVGWLGYSYSLGVSPWSGYQKALEVPIQTFLDGLSLQEKKSLFPDLEPEQMVERVSAVAPGLMGVSIFMVVLLNVILLVRIRMPSIRSQIRIAPQELKKWKVPDWLIWPTLAIIAGQYMDLGLFSRVAQNLFYIFYALFAFQGLAVLISALDAWRVRGLFRSFLVIWAIFMVSLLAGIGITDYWFDYRRRLEKKEDGSNEINS